MEQKEILPYFIYIVMFAGSITQWVPNQTAKITSYSVIGAAMIFSMLLTSIVFSKGKLGIGTVIMTYLLYAGILAILGLLIRMHLKYGDKLAKVDEDTHNPIENYEIYVRVLIMIFVVIVGKITDDAVKGKMTDVYKLMMITSIGWLVMIFGATLTGQMYVVVSRYLTDGFHNRNEV